MLEDLAPGTVVLSVGRVGYTSRTDTLELRDDESLQVSVPLAVEPKDRAEALSDAALFAATALASVAWVHRPRSLRARALALDRIAEELRAIGRSDLASAYGEASRRCRSRS